MSVSNEGLIIRADASTHIGTGHVMRCLALAQTWQDTRGDVLFAMAMESPVMEARLKSEGIEVASLPARVGSASDATQTTDLARQRGASWIVADGYRFGTAYQRAVKDSGLGLLLIDDIGHEDHYYADIVLNQNIDAEEGMYESREPSTRLLLGTRYVLLRREFLKWQGWKREISPAARRLLVSLGGSDPDNSTLKVIQALRHVATDGVEVFVLAGPSNPHYDKLRTAVADLSCPVRLESGVANMAELMAWADLATTAAGITSWELAFMQVPSLIIVTADNQWGAANGLESAEVFRLLGWGKTVSEQVLVTELRNLIQNESLRAKMSTRARRLVDGKGVERLLRTMN